MLIYFEPAALCILQTDLALAPLPAKKALWEARDESGWKVETERGAGKSNMVQMDREFGLATTGDLVRIEEGQVYCGAGQGRIKYEVLGGIRRDGRGDGGNDGNWEEWCTGMDGLGGLVVLAATMVC